MALFETLTDNFDDNSIDGAKWDAYYDGGAGSVSETGGMAQLTPSASTSPGYSTYDSLTTYDLTGSFVLVKVPQVQTANANTQTNFSLRVNDSNYFQFRVTDLTQVLYATKVVIGVEVNVATATYNSTTHAWWRIRESGGTIFWDVSSDGASWTNFATFVNTVTITAMTSRINGFADNVASPGASKFDNFNVAGVASTHGAVGRRMMMGMGQ